MSEESLIHELLGLPSVRVVRSEIVGDDRIQVHVESDLPVGVCPECGQVSQKVHDWSEEQEIRDLPIAERRCYLVYRARRFDCERCQKTFVERVEWKRPGVSYTGRFERHIYERVRHEPVSEVAQEEGLSEETAQAIFEHRAKKKWRHAAIRK